MSSGEFEAWLDAVERQLRGRYGKGLPEEAHQLARGDWANGFTPAAFASYAAHRYGFAQAAPASADQLPLL